MKYRSEIDGLRAIAVLSVLFYHAEFYIYERNIFGGGFIGVDIFFVISGYLITKLILIELFEKNSFNFLNFYERRARRILPMLLIVMLVSIPFSWKFLLPVEFIEYSKSIISAVFFGSNFFFYNAVTEYGASGSLLKPFLHTWSLGIEEQFYIIFPLLLIVFYKFLSKYLLTILIALLLLSLQFSEFIGDRNAQLNFYLPFSRFWELLFGSILAFVEIKFKIKKNELASSILPVLGLYLIVYSIIFFSDKTPHPNLQTLIPIIGVILIMYFSSQEDLVGKILGSKLFVGMGLISYSVYLWHFPIFAYARIANNSLAFFDKIGLISLTIIISFISYLFIEKPFRNKNFLSLKLFTIILLLISSILVSINILVIRKEGFQDRFHPILINKAALEKPFISLKSNNEQCYENINFCSFYLSEEHQNVYAIGDSHLSSITSDLFKRIKNEYNYFEANFGSCPFILGVDRVNKKGIKDTICTKDLQEKRLEFIGNKPAIVILAGRYPLYLSDYQSFDNKEGGKEIISEHFYSKFISADNSTLESSIINTINKILDDGHHLIQIYPIPEVGWNITHEFNKVFPKKK